MQKITPCLWFNDNAEEAVNFYTSIFKDAKIISVSHYGNEGYEVHHHKAGSVLMIEFELLGHRLTALNGGPDFKFTEAVSLQVNCKSQNEIDYYWEKLGKDGDPSAQVCGWLKDKYGLSWQIIPSTINEMFGDKSVEKADRVMKAMLQMKKIDIKSLEDAYKSE